jgi:transcription elongation GreA/GreB family factor
MEAQQVENRVRLGSQVLVAFEDGETQELTITGRQVDLAAGVISAASPLGRSLLSAHEGSSVSYSAGGAPQTVTVLRVRTGRVREQ